MRSPTGVVYILVKNSTAEEIDSAIIHARRLMDLLLDNERNMRRSNCHAKSLGDCQITANQSQAILPQVYCWAFCSDEILEYPPSIEIYNILKGDSRTILGIPLLRTKNNRLKHDLFLR